MAALYTRRYRARRATRRCSSEILSKIAIAELVWDMHVDSNTNIVELAIKRLHTNRGTGYVMEVREEWREGLSRSLR